MPFLLKRLLFRLHWIIGLSAGMVLVVVGVTGGLIGFEKPLLGLVNPQLHLSAPATAAPLPPDTLIAAAQAAWPERQPRSLSWQGDREAVLVNMAKPGQRRGGLRIAVNPYTGAVLGPLHGTDFFRTAEDLHRRLAAGPIGKQIVGASTAALILLALTGLVLRWPRHMRSLRAWLKLDLRLHGRNLLWHLHAIFGTWLLAFYLLAALTGLWWSYDFYRNALNSMAGVTGSLRPRAPPAGDPNAPLLPADTAWSRFRQLVPDATRANLSLTSQPGTPLRLRYQTPQSAHERAWNTLHLDATSGTVLSRQDYADLPRGRRFIGALYPLHAGSFFGTTGLYLMSLASLLMPLFFITGVWLWWQRRSKAARARRERLPAGAGTGSDTGEAILVLHASQSGTAEGLAWRTAGWLRRAGMAPRVLALDGSGAAALHAHVGHALFVVASYGDGGPPDSALDFVRRCMRGDAAPDLSKLRCAVLALGNRRYETFCGFGRRLSLWLHQRGAHLLFAPVEMHEADAAALAHWRRQLGHHWRIAGAGDGEPPATRHEAPFTVWHLTRHRRLNPGAQTAPLFELDFALPDRSAAWQPGDLLDVRIAPSPDRIDAWLRLWNLDADTPVRLAGEELPLRQALAHCEPPRDPAVWMGHDAQTLVRKLPALTARSYSIASVPADGCVRILVRRTHLDGHAGLASGHLSDAVSGSAAMTARLHPCPHFHAPPADAPVLLIANGVGIAPFLGMLQQRAAAAARAPAWLVYGERHPQHDGHALARLRHWQAAGVLPELDVCFSRAGDGHVQDRLRTRASLLHAWLQHGAHVMVCGSPAMGDGVQVVLEDVLGAAAVQSLRDEGRYRRELF